MQETKSTDPLPPGSTYGLLPEPSSISLPQFHELPPALFALIAQFGAVLVTLAVLAPALSWANVDFSLRNALYVQGALAAMAGLMLGLAPWWIPINLCFMPVLAWTLTLGISPGWFLGIFLLLFLVYWGVFRSQVPLYLSSRKAWVAVSELLPDRADLALLDVGSGLGGMLRHLSADRPEARFDGIENAPLPYAYAWLRRLIGRATYRIVWGNLWSHSLAPYDVVYAYLSPVPMAKLWSKAKAEMNPGACLISNTFVVPDVAPDDVVELDDFHQSRLYVYRIPANKTGEALS